MALIMKNGKVVNVSPSLKLTKAQRKKMEDAPVNKELIDRALSRNFKIKKEK